MDLFAVDTCGDGGLLKGNNEGKTGKSFARDSAGIGVRAAPTTAEPSLSDEEDVDAADYGGLPPPSVDISDIISRALESSYENLNKKKKLKTEHDKFTESMGWPAGIMKEPIVNRHARRDNFAQINPLDNELFIPKPTELTALKGIEKKESIARPSDRQLAKLKKAEREKTKGKDWFDMPATEVTEEIKNDLKILQMRSVLNPKHFYKKNDMKVIPKYFQIGTVQHSPLDYFKEKGERKNKKRTMVEELMADAEFQKFNKRKFNEVMERRHKTGYHRANQKMKKLKKKKK